MSHRCISYAHHKGSSSSFHFFTFLYKYIPIGLRQGVELPGQKPYTTPLKIYLGSSHQSVMCKVGLDTCASNLVTVTVSDYYFNSMSLKI